MKEYQQLVERAMQDAILDASSSSVFPNSGTEHAKVVLDTMLSHAAASVSIYAATMHNETFNSGLIRSFLDRSPNGDVKVLVESDKVFGDPDSALSSLTDLVDEEKIEVRLLSVHDRLVAGHFTVSDKRHIRFETSHAARTAIVSFGSDEAGRSAACLFKKLWAPSRILRPAHAHA